MWAAKSTSRIKIIDCLSGSFNYGSKHNHKENPFAAWHCNQLGIPHRVIALDFVGELFKSDLLKSGGAVPDGHYEEQSMKQTVVLGRLHSRYEG